MKTVTLKLCEFYTNLFSPRSASDGKFRNNNKKNSPNVGAFSLFSQQKMLIFK